MRKNNLKQRQKAYAKEIDNLGKLREEVVKSIQGNSAFSQQILAGLVEESEARVKTLKEECVNAEYELEYAQSIVKVLTDQYDEIVSWSELYEYATIEAKKMIVNSMIKRIDVFRGYELNIELNMNIQQFFNGIEDELIFEA